MKLSKKTKKSIFAFAILVCIILLSGCTGYSSVDGVHENYVGTWQNNPSEKIVISNKGATLYNVLQVNPINVNDEIVVEDSVYVSTCNEWGFSYNGDKKNASFETNNIVCFTDMQWKGSRIEYQDRFSIKFSGFVSAKYKELALDRGLIYWKI